MNGDKICLRHQLFQLDQFHAKRCRTRRIGIRIVGNNLRFKGTQPLGKELTDVAEADDTNSLAVDLHALEGRALPLALAQGLIRRWNLAGSGQKQGNRLLARRVDIGGGSVDHHDTLIGGGVNIHVIQSHARAAHNLELGRCF